MTTIEGTVAPGFEPVREAFGRNFAEHGDVGAAVCVYRDGQPVVDLWGGVADPETGRPWQRDTLQLVYSATKGVTATLAHLLAQRGQLDLDAPVATYWPEFAAGGKADIPVRWLLAHRAGLPVLDKPVPLADALSWQPMVDALAAQVPVWTPGTAHGYHMRSYGWLVGEVIRRITGQTPGQFLATELAGEYGIDFFIGLPAAQRPRVSRMIYDDPEAAKAMLASLSPADLPPEFRDIVAAMQDPNSLMNRATQITDPATVDFNAPEVQAAEIPASNGIGTARGLARLYAQLVGEVDGKRLLSEATVTAARQEQSTGPDQVIVFPTRFGSGYMLPTEESPLTGPNAFGHPGRGGSLAFGDPDRGIGFGYVMNRIIESDPTDPRAANLVAAVNASL